MLRLQDMSHALADGRRAADEEERQREYAAESCPDCLGAGVLAVPPCLTCKGTGWGPHRLPPDATMPSDAEITDIRTRADANARILFDSLPGARR